MNYKNKRKMFYEVLPKTSTNKINWKKSLGYNVHFIFHEFEGDVKIIDCIPSQQVIIFKYKGDEYDLDYNRFMNCTLSKIFGYEYRDGKSERQLREKEIRKQSSQIKIGDIFKDEIRDITIIDKELKIKIGKGGRKNTLYYYEYRCNKCGYEDWKVKSFYIKFKTECANCKKISSKEKRILDKQNPRKKMFLENLPKWERGIRKGKINWEKSKKHIVHFIYNEIEGDIEIIEYKMKEQELIIKYNDKNFKIAINNIRNCSIGVIVDN